MTSKPLQITDLVPKETTFTLSDFEGETYTLCRWSLRVRTWATNKYTSEGLHEIFSKQKINEIAEMAYFMLKEKNKFPSLEIFLEHVNTVQDQVNVMLALLGAIGIGEPEIEQLSANLPKPPVKEEPNDPNAKSPKSKKTGAKSLTP